MDKLGDLLSGTLRRHQITEKVTTARVIEVANEAIGALLPVGRGGDAVAAFLRDGTVLVRCQNAGAADLIARHERYIIDAIIKKLPTARVDRIRSRIGV